MPVSDARLSEARGARRIAPAQVETPRQSEAGRVECQVDDQRQMRTAGHGNRRAEAARDQVAAAGTDRADESERGTAFDAGRLQGERAAVVARCFRLFEG